jgi:hypothetical protein
MPTDVHSENRRGHGTTLLVQSVYIFLIFRQRNAVIDFEPQRASLASHARAHTFKRSGTRLLKGCTVNKELRDQCICNMQLDLQYACLTRST